MRYAKDNLKQIVQEHRALMVAFGHAQLLCSEQILTIKHMQAQVTRLRAELMICQTTLAWERDDRATQQAAQPATTRWQRLDRQMNAMLTRLHAQLHAQWHPHLAGRDRTRADGARPASAARATDSSSNLADLAVLEDSLRAADLVICQTGCVSHGNYWRVEDHCNRTGKPCVLVEAPDALRIVRIQSADAAHSEDTP